MNAVEAWREVARRKVALTPALGLWIASVDVKGEGHNRNRALRSVSATASTPIQAVASLMNKLETGETPQLDHQHFSLANSSKR